MTILNTQSSKRGTTHLRAEPAATHARWTPSTAPEPPMEAVNFLYIFRRFILYKQIKRVTFYQFFAIVSRLNKLFVNKLYQFRLTFSTRFQLLFLTFRLIVVTYLQLCNCASLFWAIL